MKRSPRRSQFAFLGAVFRSPGAFQQSFYVLGQNRVFLLTIAAASIVGAFIGGRPLGILPANVWCPLGDGAADFSGKGLAASIATQPMSVNGFITGSRHSFNHFVGKRKQGGRNGKTERLRSLEVE